MRKIGGDDGDIVERLFAVLHRFEHGPVVGITFNPAILGRAQRRLRVGAHRTGHQFATGVQRDRAIVHHAEERSGAAAAGRAAAVAGRAAHGPRLRPRRAGLAGPRRRPPRARAGPRRGRARTRPRRQPRAATIPLAEPVIQFLEKKLAQSLQSF